MEPGKTYRAVVKFCAEDLCFPPVYGNGLTVIVNPPSSGNITVQQVDEPNRHQVVYSKFQKHENFWWMLSIFLCKTLD